MKPLPMCLIWECLDCRTANTAGMPRCAKCGRLKPVFGIKTPDPPRVPEWRHTRQKRQKNAVFAGIWRVVGVGSFRNRNSLNRKKIDSSNRKEKKRHERNPRDPTRTPGGTPRPAARRHPGGIAHGTAEIGRWEPWGHREPFPGAAIAMSPSPRGWRDEKWRTGKRSPRSPRFPSILGSSAAGTGVHRRGVRPGVGGKWEGTSAMTLVTIQSVGDCPCPTAQFVGPKTCRRCPVRQCLARRWCRPFDRCSGGVAFGSFP